MNGRPTRAAPAIGPSSLGDWTRLSLSRALDATKNVGAGLTEAQQAADGADPFADLEGDLTNALRAADLPVSFVEDARRDLERVLGEVLA